MYADILGAMKRHTTDTLCEVLTRYLAGRRDVLFAYLFGSYAEGRAGGLSDIDVAVYVRQRSRSAREGARLALTSDIMRAVGMNEVDVLVLNDAPPLVAFRAVAGGIPLKESRDSARAEFEVRCTARYLDFKYYLDKHHAFLKQRIKEE